MAHSTAQPATVALPVDKRIIDLLITDLISLSYETKRKYPPVREASEACQLKLRSISAKPDHIPQGLLESSVEVVQPFILGCDTKNPKVVQLSLGAIQRLISHQLLNEGAASNVVNALWVLMEAGIEELKLLQTALLLITTSPVVQHETLARALVLCFRMHFNKDTATTNTAAATVRQLVSVVFERVVIEDAHTQGVVEPVSPDELKSGSKQAPKSLQPHAADAYLLFQDLCHLLNAEQPHWLLGMTEMKRTLCLELMEEILSSYSAVFTQHREFSFLLTEKVCSLVIRLFSPSLKYKVRSTGNSSPAPSTEKPFFPIVMRLLRIVSVLTRYYYQILVTECEIFLSLLVKFLDPEKPQWQRVTALEVLSKLCVQPQLVRMFCECYDMRQHATKVTRDIINGLAAYVQSQFVFSNASIGTKAVSSDAVGTSQTSTSNLSLQSGTQSQSSFYYRGLCLPLVLNIGAVPGSHKPIFLDLMEKTEPPPVADGYGLSLAYVCILDIVRSIQTLLQSSTAPITDKSLKEELINSSWSGVLAALTALLDASCDETATEAILKSMQIFISLCGELDMTPARDAFVLTLCKSVLPAQYSVNLVSTTPSVSADAKSGFSGRTNSQEMTCIQADIVNGNQIVAMAMPLASSSSTAGSMQGPVPLTTKNIQCLRTLLSLTQCHGMILNTAWFPILTTLQHVSWLLGLKPVPGSNGSLRTVQHVSENPSCFISTAVMSDLPVLSANFSRVFDSSQYLDDVSLHHLIDALCKLSLEAMDLASTNKEPSPFAIAKLLETGLVNMPRVEVLWKTITGHLLEVCQHSHSALRLSAAEAMVSLVKSALSQNYANTDSKQSVQVRLLLPLQQMCVVSHTDVRQRQLECILQILQNNAEKLSDGWPLVLHVIGDVTNGQNEGIIRTAFHSLHLIVTDFLPTIPTSCLPLCVDMTAKFGLQNQDLNISLTAIGLLWNIADYFSQNNSRICSSLQANEADGLSASLKLLDVAGDATNGGTSNGASTTTTSTASNEQQLTLFDSLWMTVYTRLGDLCVDLRPAVRKSAGQTLFSMISAHGSLLTLNAWKAVVWKVLFPLLDKVQKLSSQASAVVGNTTPPAANILMHHSRDTAEKQWAETRFLTLAGVAKLFSTKQRTLQQLSDFLRAWAFLLEYIESAALCQNAEISLAALKSFQDILNIQVAATDGLDLDPSRPGSDELKEMFSRPDDRVVVTSQQQLQQHSDLTTTTTTVGAATAVDSTVDETALWSQAWRVWRSIGTTVTNFVESSSPLPVPPYIPTQPYLTALISTFPALFQHIRTQFVATELHRLFTILHRSLLVPVPSTSMSIFLLPVSNGSDSPALTPLHDAVLTAVKVLIKEVLSGADNMPAMCPDLFERMLVFVDFAVHTPKYNRFDGKSVSTARNVQVEFVQVNYVSFAEAIMELVGELYRATAKFPSVIHGHVLQHIIRCLRVPLSKKYSCPSQSTWLLAINTLFAVVSVGLPVARKNEAAFQAMWLELGSTLEDFLFSAQPVQESVVAEDLMRDEALDCRVVQLIREDILPNAARLPREFIAKLMQMLNKGSIHLINSSSLVDIDSSRKLRETFAKACFETLLQFSFSSQGGTTDSGVITQLAVKSLLDRCQSVLVKFVADDRLSGKCPLPRARMTEVAFILKAVTTLLTTLKKTPSCVDKSVWNQLIAIYPALVDCTMTQSNDVSLAVHDALIQYKDLLSAPTVPVVSNGSIPGHG